MRCRESVEITEGRCTIFQRVAGIYTRSLQSFKVPLFVSRCPFSPLDTASGQVKAVADGPFAPFGSEYLDVGMQTIRAVLRLT